MGLTKKDSSPHVFLAQYVVPTFRSGTLAAVVLSGFAIDTRADVGWSGAFKGLDGAGDGASGSSIPMRLLTHKVWNAQVGSGSSLPAQANRVVVEMQIHQIELVLQALNERQELRFVLRRAPEVELHRQLHEVVQHGVRRCQQ